MVLLLIICLLKPTSPICQDKVPEDTDTDLQEVEDDFTQSELLQLGGTGLIISLLLSLLIWAISKANTLRQLIRAHPCEETAQELKDICRSVREDGRKLI